MTSSDPGFLAALEEAKAGFDEGGVPIGACLVSHDGRILGRGHNMRVQKGSATLHVGSEGRLVGWYGQWLMAPKGRDCRVGELGQTTGKGVRGSDHVYEPVAV